MNESEHLPDRILREALDHLVDSLPTARLKAVIRMRYFEEMTLTSIGRVICPGRVYSTERVRQIIGKAHRLMRHPSALKSAGFTEEADAILKASMPSPELVEVQEPEAVVSLESVSPPGFKAEWGQSPPKRKKRAQAIPERKPKEFCLSDWGISSLKRNGLGFRCGIPYAVPKYIAKCDHCGRVYMFEFLTFFRFTMQCTSNCKVDESNPSVYAASEWIAREQCSIRHSD